MTGMQNELREKILGSTPHIRVVQAGSSLRLDDWEGGDREGGGGPRE